MAEESEKTLVPTVLWAQREDLIVMRVQIKPLEKPEFKIREEYMTFKGLGAGVSGKAQYAFTLSFYEPLNTEKCRVKFSEREIEFRILKKEPNTWPRLQSAQQRPHWIRLDFDLWQEEKDSEEEGEEEGEEDPEKKRERLEKTRAEMNKLQSMMEEQVEKYETITESLGKMKVGYLVVYNAVQWIGFFLVVLMLLRSLTNGWEGVHSAYDNAAPLLMFCQRLALLEVVHAAFGLVKSGIVAAVLQVVGRYFILFVVLQPAEEIHNHPVVFVLFLVWSLIELFRYPYYALSVIDVEVIQLTWLRYTAWIPLYPVGFTCEASVVWLAIPHFEKSGDFSYPLPNPLNMSIHPPTVMRIALVLIPLVAYSLISHMVAQRKKRLEKLKSE